LYCRWSAADVSDQRRLKISPKKKKKKEAHLGEEKKGGTFVQATQTNKIEK